MIIAHRGVSFKFPENSLPAFEASWDLDVDGIEGDYHLTKDGEIICIAEPIKIGRSYQLWESKIYHNEKLCAISKVRLSKIK